MIHYYIPTLAFGPAICKIANVEKQDFDDSFVIRKDLAIRDVLAHLRMQAFNGVAANAGDGSSQVNLGNFYSDGIGVKPNRTLALYWYRRGERCAAHSIGIVFRDEKKYGEALRWFERAVKLGDGDANLEIAKIYISRNDIQRRSGT